TCERPGITVNYQLDPGAQQIVADAALLGEAFRNLTRNAVEAMPDGGELTIEARPLSDGLIEIGVADKGAGIAPENLEEIFHLYFTTKQNGTGLGLPLALRAVDLHHGTIDVSSVPGSGTTVRVRLPKGESATQDPTARAANE